MECDQNRGCIVGRVYSVEDTNGAQVTIINFLRSKGRKKMIKKIRRHVFETNSSSVHSISISSKGQQEPDLTIKRRKVNGTFGNYIIVPLNYFGKNHYIYNTQEEKLSYLLTIGYCCSYSDIDDFINSWDFKNLENQICEYVREFKSCDGILIDPKSVPEAGIDHQMLEEYSSIESFSQNGLDYKTFVFNEYVSLETDCD